MKSKPFCVAARIQECLILSAWLCGCALAAAPAEAPRDQLIQADRLVQKGNIDAAFSLLTRLASEKPEIPGVEARLGKIDYERRDYDPAIAHLELALKQNANDTESAQLLGLSYYLTGRVQQAIPLLEKVQSLLPQPDVGGSYVLGMSFIDSRQFDQARAAFAKMFSLTPDSAAAHMALAQMMIRQNMAEDAARELRAALALDPKLPMAHYLLGEIDLAHSNQQAALDEFHQELAIDPLLWLAYWRIGDAYSRLAQWDQAERALKQAIWLDENFTSPYILLARVEINKGFPETAVEFLQRALKMDPNNSSAHYLLGTAYQRLGRKTEAEHEFALTQTLNSVKDHH